MPSNLRRRHRWNLKAARPQASGGAGCQGEGCHVGEAHADEAEGCPWGTPGAGFCEEERRPWKALGPATGPPAGPMRADRTPPESGGVGDRSGAPWSTRAAAAAAGTASGAQG